MQFPVGRRRELIYLNGRGDDHGVAVVILLNLRLGVARDSYKLVGALSGAIIGLAQRFDKELETEANERIKDAKTGVGEILVVHLPIILGGDMAITEVVGAVIIILGK